jgi:ribosomal protein S13
MTCQGRYFSEEKIHRIVSLLSETDMTIAEIATRMQCSRSAVTTINRKRKVRRYNGLRSTWQNDNVICSDVTD